MKPTHAASAAADDAQLEVILADIRFEGSAWIGVQDWRMPPSADVVVSLVCVMDDSAHAEMADSKV